METKTTSKQGDIKEGGVIMPYKAYRDIDKEVLIKAKEVSIGDINETFFCHTKECPALMTLVNGANAEKAHFRRLPSRAKHTSLLCSADGVFDPTIYDEKKFDLESIIEKIMQPTNEKNQIIGTGTGTIMGGGGKKAISTVLQIYKMCRKYDVYNGFDTSEILADERNFSSYNDGIEGHKIVQCTPFHKFKDENAYRMNFPAFPYKGGKHIRLNFSTEELFWHYYNKFKDSNHKELVIVLGDWKLSSDDLYISECIITNKRQVHFLK